jgi:histidinol-phosphatase
MHPTWAERYYRAIDAVHEAGRHALEYFDRPVHVEWKENASPVTVADREAELVLRNSLLGRFAQDGFLGEEFGEKQGTSGFRWIIDPIDGTRNFVRGIPLWGTLVGLEFEGDPIAGICYFPALHKTYRALRGDGAYRDGRKIHVSTVSKLADSQIFFSGLGWLVSGPVKTGFLELVDQTQRQRGFGDCYAFCLIAQGSGEAMVEYGVHAWDVAALMPIIEEAGGVMTDWDGQRNLHRPDVLASNKLLHQEVLALLKKGQGDFQPGVLQHGEKVT